MEAVSNDKGVITAAAMDQRGSLQKSIAKAKGIGDNEVTPAMMSEFKIAVTKVLTPYASAILLDPEFGLPASKQRSKNAGLLLAYEKTGYMKDADGVNLSPTYSTAKMNNYNGMLKLGYNINDNQRKNRLTNKQFSRIKILSRKCSHQEE